MAHGTGPVFGLGAAALKYHNTSDCRFQLGQIAEDSGHLYRYCKATAAITAGNVVVANTAHVTVTNITSLDNTGDRATEKYPSVTDSGESWTPGAYVGSYLYIHGNTGVGQMKRIVKNDATTAWFGALHPGFGQGIEDDPFSTSPDTTSDITIISPWQVKKCGASDKIQTPIGTAPFAFTSGYYGWVCIDGMDNPTMGGTGVIDTVVVPGDDTAGQGTIGGTGDDIGDGTVFGIACYAGADDTRWPVLIRGLI